MNSGNEQTIKMGKVAKAAYDVVKGASTGGLHGAAAGAVKAVLPSLLKALLYGFLGLLLLVFTLYYSLPSSMFAFDGVDNAEVQAMNRQAEAARTLYGRFDTLVQEEAQKAADEIPADGYDAVSVSMELDLLGPEWTAAVCSVLYGQELDRISTEELRGMAQQYFDCETDEESWTEEVTVPPSGDDDAEDSEESEPPTTTVTKRRLLIFLQGIGAESFMTRLGFTDKQKEWARFIHDNLTQSQLAGPDFGGGDIGDLGDLTFHEGSVEVVYYNQRDLRWAYHPYGRYSVSETACGPTSLAMAVSTLSGQAVTPSEMADWAYSHGYCMPEGGSYHTLIPEGARSFGLKAEGVGRNGQRVLDALAEGKLVIAIMGPGTFTSSGHFLVLRGVTADGKILVADSYSYNYSQKEWDFSLIMREARSYAAAGGPFWVIGGG